MSNIFPNLDPEIDFYTIGSLSIYVANIKPQCIFNLKRLVRIHLLHTSSIIYRKIGLDPVCMVFLLKKLPKLDYRFQGFH